jgi:hypothetical protein
VFFTNFVCRTGFSPVAHYATGGSHGLRKNRPHRRRYLHPQGAT